MYSNNYIRIKNIILGRQGYSNIVINSDSIELYYYNCCQPQVFKLDEELSLEELEDLLQSINLEPISCDNDNIISEDNC